MDVPLLETYRDDFVIADYHMEPLVPKESKSVSKAQTSEAAHEKRTKTPTTFLSR
jgi:hypothetical protein